VNKAPNTALDRLTAEYLRFMLSAEGQRVVVKAGFDPLDEQTAAAQRAQIGD
jgi:phosphate transport system substrate-binding protein